MFKKITPIFFLVVVVGLLVWQRFDTEPSQTVRVVAAENSPRSVGENLKRGEYVETDEGEYLAISINDIVTVGLYEKSRIELHRLFENERILRFDRGRIVINNPDSSPLFVDTRKTENAIQNGSVTIINFDFLQEVHIIPLEGSVQTTLKGSNEFLSLPVPISVDESSKPVYKNINFDPQENAANDFYLWFDQHLDTNAVQE